MRRPDPTVWTVILLAFPLVRCAVGADVEPSSSARGGRPSGGQASGGAAVGSGGTSLPAAGGTRFVSGGTAAGGAAIARGGAGGGAAGLGGGMAARGGSSGSAGTAAGSTGAAGLGNAGAFTSGGTGASGKGGAAGAAPFGGAIGAAGKGGAGTSGCSNGLKDGSETDRDCGGSACTACGQALSCAVDGDCTSKQCLSLKCTADTCGDAALSGTETDVDCGGSCKPCALDKACSVAADCQGKNCSAGKCGVPNHCAYGWRDSSTCAMACLGRTQGDQLKCKEVLDCYVAQECGPATCSANDQKCGANTLGFGSAPYPYAQQVHDCLCKA